MSKGALYSEKPKSDRSLFVYKGQEVVQVVEELMEQTCILKNGLQDMIESFKNKICDCKPNNGKVDKSKRRTSSDSSLSAWNSVSLELKDGSVPMEGSPPETNQVRLRGGQSGNSLALLMTPEATEASFLTKQTEIEQKLVKVQQELEELRYQMSLLSSCTCKTKEENGGHAKTSENELPRQEQLLDKADEIKEILIGMQEACCEELTTKQQSNVPTDTGKETMTKTCQTEERRPNLDYTRTINQEQNVEAERKRQGSTEMSNGNDELENSINNIQNEYRPKQNIHFQNGDQKQTETTNSDNQQRKSTCLADKTIKAGENTYREVNTVMEKDVTYPEARIIRTSKKTVRTEIVEGPQPPQKIITNIRIKRTINNRTGEIREVIYEGDDLSEVDESEIELLRSIKVVAMNENSRSKEESTNKEQSNNSEKNRCSSPERIRGGQNGSFDSSKLTPISSIGSASMLLNKRNYDTNGSVLAESPSKEQIKSSDVFEENPLFYNRHKLNGKGSKRLEDNSAGSIRYIATNSEIQGGSLVGCKFGGTTSQSSGRRNGLNLGGQTDSYFIELANEQNRTEQNGQRQFQSETNNPFPSPSSRNPTGINPEVSIRSVDIDNIQNVVGQLSGNRPYSQFFLSVLPEKHQSKNFRINVVDKESGNLLGYFYVDEEKFHQARLDGIFDNFLSLFVLNSLGSYNDFKTGINPEVLNKGQCFGE